MAHFSFSQLFCTLLLFINVCKGHGKLTVPLPRGGSAYQNDPVSGPSGTDFVCRYSLTTPSQTVTAGGTLGLQWDFGAAHLGDCAVYISYDYTLDNASQRYFKIANLYDCRSQNNVLQTINIPDWLPAGQAILRWDWYALHQWPSVEFYTQCVDITITNSGSAASVDSLVKYTIPGLYPATGNDAPGYRAVYSAGTEMYMTGPPCANGYTGNDCGLTAAGTTGHIDVGESGDAPVSDPTPQPTYAAGVPTPDPTAAATSPCEVYSVDSGETLSTIATYYTNQGSGWEVTWQEICEANELQDCDMINPGDDLVIPCSNCGCDAAVQDPNAGAAEDSSGGNTVVIIVVVFFVLLILFLVLAYFGVFGLPLQIKLKSCCGGSKDGANTVQQV